MKGRDMEIALDGVQATLLLPLLARARDAERKNSVLSDSYAKDIVAKLRYDFAALEEGEHTEGEQLNWVIRAWNFDNTARSFFADAAAAATVVNIGAGLDTTFQRIDDGKVQWFNIDLPDVAALRSSLIPDTEREVTIAKSVFDYSWLDDVAESPAGRRVLLMAAGVLFYFNETEVGSLFRQLARQFPNAHFVFDAMSSPIWIALTNWQMHRTGKLEPTARLRWHIRKASRISRYVRTARVVEEYSMFSRIAPRDEWGKKLIRDLRIADFLGIYRMIHVTL